MIETFNRIWKFSANRHKNLIRALILSFFRSVFGVTQIMALMTAVNVIRGNENPSDGVIKICILALICVVGNFFTSYIEQTSTMETGFYMTGDKRVSVGQELRKIPLGYFNETSAGKICASLTTTLTGVETAATMVMVGIVSGLFCAAALFIFMMFYEWKIGILTGVGMAVYLLIVNYQMKLSGKNAPALQKAQTELTKAALTFLQGIKVTKAFSFRNGDKQFKEAIKNSRDENISLTGKSMPSQFAASICIAFFESLILILSLYLSVHVETVDLSKAVVLVIFSFMVYASLNQAGSMLSMIGLLDTGLQEIEQIDKVEKMKQEEPEQTPESEEIVINHVSFAYGDHEVLHDVSTVIHPRSLTALIGPSGSGKTTLCQLIPRFRDVAQGKITIGGADIKHMDTEKLMEKISMVFQNVYLFEDTIANNIRFGKPEADMEEIRRAAKAARCDEFIMNMPDGYDTVLDEGGNTLSGGEKQRISIARAMLKDAPIIILDEATSALDAENEHDILSAIDELTKNKTVIMIAHRIKSVEKADHIIVLQEGRIVQEGTHESLKNAQGLYADFLSARKEAETWSLNV